jgi:hypothetical protein
MNNFWYKEWMYAEKEGHLQYALACKEKYRQQTIDFLKKPYNLYYDQLRQFPFIYLN